MKSPTGSRADLQPSIICCTHLASGLGGTGGDARRRSSRQGGRGWCRL